MASVYLGTIRRWLDPNPKNHPSLLTFGHGPHTCVGMALYIYEAKTVGVSSAWCSVHRIQSVNIRLFYSGVRQKTHQNF
jgi:hypothetical protein